MCMSVTCHYFQVTDAQGHEAPIQRLADKIAGPFVYTVMTLSAATFAFWYVIPSQHLCILKILTKHLSLYLVRHVLLNPFFRESNLDSLIVLFPLCFLSSTFIAGTISELTYSQMFCLITLPDQIVIRYF